MWTIPIPKSEKKVERTLTMSYRRYRLYNWTKRLFARYFLPTFFHLFVQKFNFSPPWSFASVLSKDLNNLMALFENLKTSINQYFFFKFHCANQWNTT